MAKKMRFQHRLKMVLSLIRDLESSGMLESGQQEALAKSLKNLDHALRVQDFDKVRSAIDDTARHIINTDITKLLEDDRQGN